MGVFFFVKSGKWRCFVKRSGKWGVFCKKWTFPQRRVHYVQYQYFLFHVLLIWGGAYAPNAPPPGWRRGVVVSGVRRMNEVNTRRARLVPGWVTSSGRYTISVCNKPPRSTQPCIPPGSLNRVPASAGVRAGMSPLPGGR